MSIGRAAYIEVLKIKGKQKSTSLSILLRKWNYLALQVLKDNGTAHFSLLYNRTQRGSIVPIHSSQMHKSQEAFHWSLALLFLDFINSVTLTKLHIPLSSIQANNRWWKSKDVGDKRESRKNMSHLFNEDKQKSP